MTNAHESTSPVLYRILLIGGFLLALFSPFVAQVAGLRLVDESGEKRILAAAPELPRNSETLEQFPGAFEAWFNDHFGFRDALIRLHNYALFFGLHASGSDRVLIGKGQWLFLRIENALESWRREKPRWLPSELEQWRRVILERQRYFARAGIPYLFVATPAKGTIYPEYYPSRMSRVRKEGRLEQLSSYFSKHPEVPYVDVTGALLKRKERMAREGDPRFLFWPTDTHWNHMGSFVGYSAMMKKLREFAPQYSEALKPFAEEDGVWIDRPKLNGDLSVMLGLVPLLPVTDHVIFPKKLPESIPHFVAITANGARDRISTWDREGLPNAFFIHDSFLTIQYEYISAHFKRAWFRWVNDFDLTGIEKAKPSVVVQEVTERFLTNSFPTNPVGIRFVEDDAILKQLASESIPDWRSVEVEQGLTLEAAVLREHEEDYELILLWKSNRELTLDGEIQVVGYKKNDTVLDRVIPQCQLRSTVPPGHRWIDHMVLPKDAAQSAEHIYFQLWRRQGSQFLLRKKGDTEARRSLPLQLPQGG